ncbi:MAG: hypothetical protein KKD77_22995 [Gammaproteobacteria bacterium]|nr:hypothetical protein [Gammaproteobacteria bacterium]
MLTKLLPDQISTFWPIIKYAVEESLPPIAGEHPDKMNRILSAMLSGLLEVWVSYKKPSNKFEAVVVTQFLYDDASNTKNLLLYCLYGYEQIDPSSWDEGWIVLSKYAKTKKCHSIMAYSANPYLVELAKTFGGNTDYTFISLALNKIV